MSGNDFRKDVAEIQETLDRIRRLKHAIERDDVLAAYIGDQWHIMRNCLIYWLLCRFENICVYFLNKAKPYV